MSQHGIKDMCTAALARRVGSHRWNCAIDNKSAVFPRSEHRPRYLASELRASWALTPDSDKEPTTIRLSKLPGCF